MSKTIFEAAEACVNAIWHEISSSAIVSTSRIYPSTKAWYVQAHTEVSDGSYLIAYMWDTDWEPQVMTFSDEDVFSRYMANMYDLPD